MPSSAVGKAVVRIASSQAMARSPRLLSHGRLVVLLGALSAFGPLSMDMYLPGLPSMARDLSGARVGGAADDHHLDAGARERPARRRPDQRRARAPAPAARRPGRLRGGLAAVRRRPHHLAAARLPRRPGRRRRGRDRHRARDRARPARPASRPRASSPCSCSSAAWRRSSLRWSAASCCTSPTGAGSSSCSPASARCCWSRPGRCWPRRSRRGEPPRRRPRGNACASSAGSCATGAFMGYTLSAGPGLRARWRPTSPARRSCCRTSTALSPQLFSVIFALNAVGIMVASQVSRALVRRYGPRAMLNAGVVDRRGGRPRRARLGRGRPRARRPAARASS